MSCPCGKGLAPVDGIFNRKRGDCWECWTGGKFVPVDKALGVINRGVVPHPSAEMVERIQLQLAVPPRDRCRWEGDVSENCPTCTAEVSEQNHVRLCLHPNPSPKGTTNERGTAVDGDRDKCTRNNFNNLLQRCWNCPDYESPKGNDSGAPSRIVLDNGAGGIGDGIMGLTAVAGLREQYPQAEIVYNVSDFAAPFVKLFAGPSSVGRHAKAHTDQPTPGARQLNQGYYATEHLGTAPVPRWERYATNAGARRAVVPPLLDPAAVDRAAVPGLRGAALLFPLCTDLGRTWPLFKWIQLEGFLLAAGYRVAIIGDKPLLAGFRSPVLLNLGAATLTGTVRNAGIVVANDSGPAHVAGVTGAPVVIVGGMMPLANIFAIYPGVRFLSGKPIETWGVPEVMDAVEETVLKHRLCHDDSLLDWQRLRTIRDAVNQTRDVPGWLAELGVYRGGVAKLMGTTDPAAKLMLFDTFAGIPEDDRAAGGHHKRGEFAAGIAQVKRVLDGLQNFVRYVVGKFPDSLFDAPESVNAARFRVVHVDGDTEQTTEAACCFFSPRMARGGVMIFDDYGWPATPGVKPVVDRWFGSRVQQTTGSQAIVRF